METMKESHIARDLLKLQHQLIQSRERRRELRSRIAELKSEKSQFEKHFNIPYQTNQPEALQIKSETLELERKQKAIAEQNQEVTQDLERVGVLIQIVREEMHQIQRSMMEAQEEKRRVSRAIKLTEEERFKLQAEVKCQRRKMQEQSNTIEAFKKEIDIEKCLNTSLKASVKKMESKQCALSLDLTKKQQELAKIQRNVESITTERNNAEIRRKIIKNQVRTSFVVAAKVNAKLSNVKIK